MFGDFAIEPLQGLCHVDLRQGDGSTDFPDNFKAKLSPEKPFVIFFDHDQHDKVAITVDQWVRVVALAKGKDAKFIKAVIDGLDKESMDVDAIARCTPNEIDSLSIPTGLKLFLKEAKTTHPLPGTDMKVVNDVSDRPIGQRRLSFLRYLRYQAFGPKSAEYLALPEIDEETLEGVVTAFSESYKNVATARDALAPLWKMTQPRQGGASPCVLLLGESGTGKGTIVQGAFDAVGFERVANKVQSANLKNSLQGQGAKIIKDLFSRAGALPWSKPMVWFDELDRYTAKADANGSKDSGDITGALQPAWDEVEEIVIVINDST